MLRSIGLAAIAATLAATSAFAADIAVKAPPAPVQYTCTVNSCSGWYGGLSLYGEGGNADVIGNGINGSIFAGGGMVGVNGGYELWNGSWFVAAQADLLFESLPNANTAGFVPGGFVGMIHAKVGGNAAALFGVTPTNASPSQGPVAINIPTQLLSALMSPYLDLGCVAWRKNTTQWCSGAGAQFNIGNRWTLDVLYDYAPPTTKVNALNIVGVQADYHW